MKLKKIKIHNLFQYSDLEISFSGNLVGIIGKNGTGKSNFLNSLHFAFSGEVPGKTKEQVLKWGADSGYAIVEFEHAGKEGRIERHTPGTKASFKYGDEPLAVGIRQVNEAVLNMLGMDKDVFRLVFVKQAELDSILFDQASKREVAFQRMCGLGEANRLHKNLSDLIDSTFNDSPGDIEATISALKSSKETSEVELADTKAEYNKLTEQMKKYGALPDLISARDKYTEAAKLKFALHNFEESGKSEEQELEKLKFQLAEIGTSVREDIVSRAQVALEEEEKKLLDVEVTEKEISEHKTRLEANQTTVATLQEESKDFVNLKALEEQAEAESRKLAKGRAMAALYKAAIEASKIPGEASGICPICGQSLPHSLQASFFEKLAECHTDDTHFKKLSEQIEMQRRKATELSAKLSMLVGIINDDTNWLAAHPSIGVENLNIMRGSFAEMQKFVKDLDDKYTQVKQLEWKIKTLASSIGSRKQSCEEHKARLLKLGISEIASCDEVNRLQSEAVSNLEEFNKLFSTSQAVASTVALIERRIIGINQNIRQNEAKLANTANREEAYKTLLSVKNWLHYSNGPHKLSQRVMSDLTSDTNKFLETLGAPFSVSVDPETLGYMFSMNDGSGPDTPMPAEALSGGQKVLLAVAFRLASYCMFAGKYGLLSLDEPTAYLDDANVANFCSLLESIKATAVSMDLQILISTHERAVLPYMDSVLDIDAAKA